LRVKTGLGLGMPSPVMALPFAVFVLAQDDSKTAARVVVKSDTLAVLIMKIPLLWLLFDCVAQALTS
jgi:hypothetical protein